MSDSPKGSAVVPRASKPRRRKNAGTPETVLRIPDYSPKQSLLEDFDSLDDSGQSPNALADAVVDVPEGGEKVELPAKRPSVKAQLTAAAIIAGIALWLMIVFSRGNKADIDASSIAADRPKTDAVAAKEEAVAARRAERRRAREAEQVAAKGMEDVESLDEVADITEPQLEAPLIDETLATAEIESAVEDISTDELLDEPYIASQEPLAADDAYVEPTYIEEPYRADDRETDYPDGVIRNEYATVDPNQADAAELSPPTRTNQGQQVEGPQFGPTLQSPLPGERATSTADRTNRDSAYLTDQSDLGRRVAQPNYRSPTNDQRFDPRIRNQRAEEIAASARQFNQRPTQTNSTPIEQVDYQPSRSIYPSTDPSTYWYPPNQFGESIPRTATRQAVRRQ